MKKIFLPIFLLLASPALAVNIPNDQKQQLGQKIGQAVLNKNLENGAELAQKLFDLQEQYTEQRDQTWIQNKFQRLAQIEGLEVPANQDLLQFPLDEEEPGIIETKPSSGRDLWSFLRFGSNKENPQENLLVEKPKKIEQEPVFGPENNSTLKNENFSDLSQSTLFVVQENNNTANELRKLIAQREKIEKEQKDLTIRLNELDQDLTNVRLSIGLVLDKSNQAKEAIEQKRQEKETALEGRTAEIQGLIKKLEAAQAEKNKIEQDFKVLSIEKN